MSLKNNLVQVNNDRRNVEDIKLLIWIAEQNKVKKNIKELKCLHFNIIQSL